MKTQQHDKAVKLYEIKKDLGAPLLITEDDSLIDSAVTLIGNDNEVSLSSDGSKVEGVIVGFEDGKVAVRFEGEMHFKNAGVRSIPSGASIIGASRLIRHNVTRRDRLFTGYIKPFVADVATRGSISDINSQINASICARGTVLEGGANNQEEADVVADVLVRLPS